MWARLPKVKFSNGFEIPVIGLGTYLTKGEAGVKTIKQAIDIGYRHIDTAYRFGNEREVGRAVNEKMGEGYISRENLFISTKLWSSFHAPEHVAEAFKISLKNLKLSYVDLYLMHMPMALPFRGFEQSDLVTYDQAGKVVGSNIDFCDTWKIMEGLVNGGRVRSLGVSNFNIEQLKRLMDCANVKPVVNQVEVNPGFSQKPLIKFCKENDIAVIAYSPLGRVNRPDSYSRVTADVLQNPEVIDIAEKYEKKPTQVVLRYLIQLGTIPIPMASNRAETVENIDIFDFALTPEEMSLMEKFDNGRRAVPLKQYSHLSEFPFKSEEI